VPGLHIQQVFPDSLLHAPQHSRGPLEPGCFPWVVQQQVPHVAHAPLGAIRRGRLQPGQFCGQGIQGTARTETLPGMLRYRSGISDIEGGQGCGWRGRWCRFNGGGFRCARAGNAIQDGRIPTRRVLWQNPALVQVSADSRESLALAEGRPDLFLYRFKRVRDGRSDGARCQGWPQ
jgi:hypothetical protein